MKHVLTAALVVGGLGLGLAAREQSGAGTAQRPVPTAAQGSIAAPKPSAPASAPKTPVQPTASHPAGMPVTAQAEIVAQYCAGCHSDRAKAGGLSLHGWTPRRRRLDPAIGEDDPQAARRHDAAGRRASPGRRARSTALTVALESRIDRAAPRPPIPGSRPFQRLNRAEYARAVKDMLGVDIDVAAFLPADTISNGFDNVADAQTFSPTLMESYLRAAAKVTALADRRSRRARRPQPTTACRRPRRNWRASRARRSARAAASRSRTRSRPTAITCSGSTSQHAAASSSADRTKARQSRCRSTASAWRSSRSIRA